MRTSIPGVVTVPEVIDALDVIIVPVVPVIPAIPPILVSTKCSLCLKKASIEFHYYESIGCFPTSININYSNILRNFYIEWEAMTMISAVETPEVPLISKNFTPIKWIESFKYYMSRTYGIRNTPLLYSIREMVAVSSEVEDRIKLGSLYGSSGSVIDEIITRLSHTHSLFRNDNNPWYHLHSHNQILRKT